MFQERPRRAGVAHLVDNPFHGLLPLWTIFTFFDLHATIMTVPTDVTQLDALVLKVESYLYGLQTAKIRLCSIHRGVSLGAKARRDQPYLCAVPSREDFGSHAG